MELALRDPLQSFYDALALDDLIPPQEFEAGLRSLSLQLERVALDAHTATVHEVSFAEAAQDWDNYPHLARIHAAFDDILTMSLPPTLARWVTRLISAPEPPALEELGRALVSAADSAPDPRLHALARFALFEGVRLNVVLMARWNPRETFGVGIEMIDLDRIAEETVAKWLSAQTAVPADTRPFHVIVAAALTGLTHESEALRDAVRTVHADIRAELLQRAEYEQAFAEMDIREGLLIRNAVAPALDEQKLTVEHLQQRHAMVLGDVSRNALDQRLGRAVKKGTAALKRRRVALFDLLRAAAGISPALAEEHLA
ncbi:MAG: hypothetical protein Tsb0020_37270 [Haliangiales bacterium]